MTDVLEQTPPEPASRARRPAPRHARRRSPRAGSTRLAGRLSSVSIRGLDHVRDRRGGRCVFTLAQLHPDLLFSNTTPTGGDMGAHVWGPAYLRDHILPHWRLSGWAPDWYAGFPMYRFYMVVPGAGRRAARTSCCPTASPSSSSAISGVLSLPICCWAFGKLAGLRFPMPALFSAIVGVFLFDESFHDLRRQHRIDDGGRVLVLDRPVARDALPRRASPTGCARESTVRSRPCCSRCACSAT